MNLPENEDFISRVVENPEKWNVDGFTAAQRVAITYVVDNHGISINDVRQHGLEVTRHGLVIARTVRRADGRIALRPPQHIRVRAQLLTGATA